MNIPSQTDRTLLQQALTDWVVRQCPVDDSEPPETFLVRARQVAHSARPLRQLADAAETLGFQPLPLPDFLSTVARTARVSLGRLLPLVQDERSPVSPWISLAKSIGIRYDQLRLLARLWIAERHASFVDAPEVLTRGGSQAATPSAICAAGADELSVVRALDQLEAGYDDECRALLTACMAEIER